MIYHLHKNPQAIWIPYLALSLKNELANSKENILSPHLDFLYWQDDLSISNQSQDGIFMGLDNH